MINQQLQYDLDKPIPKAHLFLHRLRKINSIDREIRQKWLSLHKKKSQYQRNLQGLISQQNQMRVIKDQNDQKYEKVKEQNKVAKIRSQVIREEVHLRKKQYDQVYFKKVERNNKPILTTPLSKSRSLTIAPTINDKCRIKTQGNDKSPLMFRKRTKAMQRELNAIRNRYDDGLRQASNKKDKEQQILWQSQKDMVRKMKGSKFYYKFAASWQPTY